MAIIHGNFFSQALQVEVQIEIALPEPVMDGGREPLPVLYLLHGNSDDATVWQRLTGIERYANRYYMAVVMPGVWRYSFYLDQAQGDPYYTYISEEVPRIAQRLFKVSKDREHTFVAGLSMGGYGAMHWAFAHPEQFSAVASLSAGIKHELHPATLAQVLNDPEKMRQLKRENPAHYQQVREYTMTFGSVKADEANDDVHLIRQARAALAAGKKLPDLFMACGREDVLYRDNLQYHRELTELGVKHVYQEGPGSHNWEFWDEWIQTAMAWFSDKDRAQQ
jgi:S-formylglutathione hydrolase FrmB